MDVKQSMSMWDELLDRDVLADNYDSHLHRMKCLKNSVIGSNRRKDEVLTDDGALDRVAEILCADDVPLEMRMELVVILGSVCKGRSRHLRAVAQSKCVPVLLKLLQFADEPLTEAICCCLKSIFASNSNIAPLHLLYSDDSVLPLLLKVLPTSITSRECVATILSSSCKTLRHQQLLMDKGALMIVAPSLFSRRDEVVRSSLQFCFAAIRDNKPSARAFVGTIYDETTLFDRAVRLIDRSRPPAVQVAASKCVAAVYRVGLLTANDVVVTQKAMPTLVRWCKEEPLLNWSVTERAEAVEALAYLTEEEVSLQRLAAENNQCLRTLAACLRSAADLDERQPPADGNATKGDEDLERLERVALVALSSLALNDDDIRRKIGSAESAMFEPIVRMAREVQSFAANEASGMDGEAAIGGPGRLLEVFSRDRLLAVCRCLHAMSRSVEQLRTSFQDQERVPVWTALLLMASSSDEELCAVASATLCNLCLDFSPCREYLWLLNIQQAIEGTVLNQFVSLSLRENASLRLNGVWGLMNLSYRGGADLKAAVMKGFGSDNWLRMITEAPADSPVLITLLSLARNVLAEPQDGFGAAQHIDRMMDLHGNAIIQGIIFILEGDYKVEVKELSLCILANIAAGSQSKLCIMSNEDVLKKVASYMMAAHTSLQIAATFCVTNLVWRDDPGSLERCNRLQDDGVCKILQQLSQSNEPGLQERAKTALFQFQTS